MKNRTQGVSCGRGMDGGAGLSGTGEERDSLKNVVRAEGRRCGSIDKVLVSSLQGFPGPIPRTP